MKIYQFTKKSAKKKIKKQLYSIIPLCVIGVFCGMYMANNESNGIIFRNTFLLILSILFILLFLCIGLVLIYRIGMKGLMREMYLLSTHSIEKKNPSGSSVKILFKNASRYKSNKKGMMIQSGKNTIFIPNELDEFEELLEIINEKLK